MGDGQLEDKARDCNRGSEAQTRTAPEHYELAARLGVLLMKRGWQVSAAESCTGGLLGGALTAVPGASAYFASSYVVYSNAAKARELGVDLQLLSSAGAVSEAVVCAMAAGARQRAEAQLAVAISGVAGPDGGSPDKPVGTVWLAVMGPGGCRAECHRFGGDRAAVRQAAVDAALAALVAHLELYK